MQKIKSFRAWIMTMNRLIGEFTKFLSLAEQALLNIALKQVFHIQNARRVSIRVYRFK